MPIQVLSPQLANQIAAGEVVERPASVVKELVENSLDAGATRIDLEIEKGGAKLIRIRDNGAGISKEELTLSLLRHATSKIASLEDLEAIMSLGFRGEALASISSVSRLSITSRTETQTEAWQAYTEGREMAVTVKPASHPVGTSVEVLDLFYNTPARRRFLRTEKTEFTHIDEVIRRIALARFDVAIYLHHNGKLIRQYRAANDEVQREKRLTAICGAAFVQHALSVTWQHADLSIHGWVAKPTATQTIGELQYCYVNGRMMKDRLINHAIRQAYQERLSEGQQPAYVLYLELDPHQVDVNVHPAKHEVRFHEARLVHDFIYQAVLTVLQQEVEQLSVNTVQEEEVIHSLSENRVVAGNSIFQIPAAQPKSGVERVRDSAPKEVAEKVEAGASREASGVDYSSGSSSTRQHSELYYQLMKPATVTESMAAIPTEELRLNKPTTSTEYSFGKVLTVIQQRFALLDSAQQLFLLSLPAADCWLHRSQLTPEGNELRPQPLLIPLQMVFDNKGIAALQHYSAQLTTLGINFTVEKKRVTLHTVSMPLRQQNLQALLPEFVDYLLSKQDITQLEIIDWLSVRLAEGRCEWNQAQAIQLLSNLEQCCPKLIKNPPANLLQPIELQLIIEQLTT